MKVTNNSVNNIHSTETNAAKRAQEAAKKENAQTERARGEITGDAKAEISTKAKDMGKIKEAAMSAPDVREAKIAELKQRIQNKEYNIKPDDIAERLVNEHIKTRNLG